MWVTLQFQDTPEESHLSPTWWCSLIQNRDNKTFCDVISCTVLKSSLFVSFCLTCKVYFVLFQDGFVQTQCHSGTQVTNSTWLKFKATLFCFSMMHGHFRQFCQLFFYYNWETPFFSINPIQSNVFILTQAVKPLPDFELLKDSLDKPHPSVPLRDGPLQPFSLCCHIITFVYCQQLGQLPSIPANPGGSMFPPRA